MNLADLIQSQTKAIDAAVKDASRQTRTEADLAAPAGLYNARIARIDARIADLEAQRAETDKRLGDAIDEQKQLRDEMVKEAKVWADRAPTKPTTPPVGRPVVTTPTPKVATATPAPAAKAAKAATTAPAAKAATKSTASAKPAPKSKPQ